MRSPTSTTAPTPRSGPASRCPAANHNVYQYQPTLIYTATATNRPYGEANPVLTGSVGPLVNGDTAADAYNSGTAVWASPAVAGSNVGSYAITGSGLTSDIGYAFAQAPSNATAMTVNPRPVTVTANAGQGKVYGDADPVLTYVVANGAGTTGTAIFAGDSLTGALARTAGETVAGGPYAINQGTLDANVPTNYAITYVGNTFAITPASLAVAADAKTKIYGEADPALTYVASGFKVRRHARRRTLGRTRTHGR